MNRTTCGLIVLTLTLGVGLAAVPASAQTCAWKPWANASWGQIITGPDRFPPNQVYNPANWDYSFSQLTVLNTTKDTPPGGGAYALHWFLDAQPPATQSNGIGSGGVYQEIAVTQGMEVKYSFWWKGAQNVNGAWFEFMLMDGPFTTQKADWGSSPDPNPAPWIMRKHSSATFGWEQLTDTSTCPSCVSPSPSLWNRIPTGNVVTVVLKAGRNPTGAMEAFFDNVQVWQGSGPNLVVDGDFEDLASQGDCDNQLVYKDTTTDPGQAYWREKTTCPQVQHTIVAPVSPTTHDNASDTTMTITGTYLEVVAQAKLVPVAGGAEIIGTFTPPSGPNATSMTVSFPTTEAVDGTYDLVTTQGASPPCLIQRLSSTFQLTCPTSSTIDTVSPPSVTNPDSSVQLTLTGANLDLLSSLSLVYRVAASPPTFSAGSLVMNNNDLIATFDLSCAPAGPYDLVATRGDVCRPPTKSNALLLVKPPLAGGCVWQPWASNWSTLNLGSDLNPPNLIYDPTNWDYTFTQQPSLGMPLDTPDASPLALHWFLDGYPPDNLGGNGSGGVFQQITVQPGAPLQYSYYWKGAAEAGSSWFEFLLIDGPFNVRDADLFQESAAQNNPALIRKKSLTGSSFGWQQVTDQTNADSGPAGPRPQTITPTGTTVTVVLKAGRDSMGSTGSLWDNVVVTQNGGPNLVTNGDFENPIQAGTCDHETVFKDTCESSYWRRSTFVLLNCPVPFADADRDGDVDQADFAAFQACYTGSGSFTLSSECQCFDRPEPINPDGDIDVTDLLKFENCASGPGILANPTCGG